MLGMVEVELARPERLVDGAGHHDVVEVVLAVHRVRVERHERVRLVGPHGVDDPLAQVDRGDVAQRVGRVPEFDDVRHAEDCRGPLELLTVRGDRRRRVGPDGVPPVVGGPDDDDPPTGV